jgi:hypothetical protein
MSEMSDHRYILRRNWGFAHPGKRVVVNFIMLNPSTADDNSDDATIRRCVGFATRWGFDGLVVTNLFAYRATDPSELKALAATDARLAIGDENEAHLKREADAANSIVCAWGDNCEAIPHRGREVLAMLRSYNLLCIRRTKRGNPAHPVRERYTGKPETFASKFLTENERAVLLP